MWLLLLTLTAITLLDSVQADGKQGNLTKDVIDFCWPEEPDSCGPSGVCLKQPTGNRCTCPDHFMGKGCQRPCQDIYRSCERWLEEKRCEWAKPISPFFFDNCPLTCGQCKAGKRKLKVPLPPILEPLSWLIGRWKTRTVKVGLRYPVSLSGAYEEVLDFALAPVPAFDRPPINVSVRATLLSDGSEQHTEVGFMTGKPFREDTGFAVKNKPTHGDDLVAIEMVSNNGLITIEEGVLLHNSIQLSVKHKVAYLGNEHPTVLRTANRTFTLISPRILEEHTRIVYSDGRISKFRKKYIKVFDYLTDFVDTGVLVAP